MVRSTHPYKKNNNSYTQTCTCNVAHKYLYDFDHAVKYWTPETELASVIEETLGCFRLGGKSGLLERDIGQLNSSIKESIACTRFLLRAESSLVRVPPFLVTHCVNYWPALARVLIEVVRYAKEEDRRIDEKDKINQFLKIFSKQGVFSQEIWQQRYKILEGLLQFVTDTRDDPEWLDQKSLFWKVVEYVFLKWQAAVNVLEGDIPSIIFEGIGCINDIWFNLSIVYSEKKQETNEKGKTHQKKVKGKLDFLGNQITRNAIPLFEMIYGAKNSMAIGGAFDNYRHIMGNLITPPLKREIRQELIKVAQRIQEVIDAEQDERIKHKCEQVSRALDRVLYKR